MATVNINNILHVLTVTGNKVDTIWLLQEVIFKKVNYITSYKCK